MVKAGLAVFLALWTPVQAAEPAFDALSHLLREYAGPVDAAAAEAAPEDGAPPGERLAKVSADLALMAEGLETFRASGPGAIPGDFAPELTSHFQDRDAALAAVYRTLAVTDYTWAMRFDGGDCAPRERRSALLADPDGLFAGPDGSVSPWLARLLGPASAGKSSAEALDRASRRGSLSARDYELLRVKAAKIAEALRSERAEGAERARLYCRRAEIHESLASAHRAAGAPIAAGLATAGRASDSVFLMVWSSGPATARAVGAGVLLDTPAGPKAFTDARLSPREGWTLSAVVRGRDGRLGARHPFKAESVDAAAGILVGTVPGASVPALKATAHPAELADLVRSIGHVGAAGAWSMAQGLVTETGGTTFASDAVLGPDMLGSPLLNEEGELVGLVVLSPSGSPVAVRVDRLLQAAQAAPAPGEVEFVAARQSGSASLLTTAMPITGALTGAGEGAVEAGLPSSMGGVNWEGGGGVGNWRPRSSAGPPRGYSSRSSGSSSSYSSGSSPGAEIGAELGKALAPLVEALIFKGIPALFRGVGSLFKSKPKAPIVKAKASEKPRPVATERKPDPKYEVRIVPERAQVEEGQPVRFIATVTANRPEMPLGNIVIKFNVRGAEEVSGVTDSSGRIVLTVDPPVSPPAALRPGKPPR